MKPRKFERVNFWKFLPRAFYVLVSLDRTSDNGTIALFQTVLPFPTGHLSSSVSPATIKGRGQQLALNAKICSGRETGFSRKFGPAKLSCYTVPEFLLIKSKIE